VGRFVVRRDHPHAKGGAGLPGGHPAESPRRDGVAVDERLAHLVGEGGRVLIFSREAAALARTLEAKGCRTVAVAVAGRRPGLDLDPGRWSTPGHREASEDGGVGADGTDDGRFDAIVVADLLGRIDDPRAALRALKDQIRPGGSLIVSLTGIAPIGGGSGGRLAIVDGEPLGAGSGVLFSEEGLLGLLEDADYVVGHVERSGPATGADAPGLAEDRADQDCLIVAHPLPVPGLDHFQRRMHDLIRQARDAGREAEELRRHAAVADHRLEILSGNERRMAERIKDLRGQLLDAHAEMIRRDDEIRTTFGDAIFHRNALLIERDALIGQREALLAERSALLAQCEAMNLALRSANLRLNFFRMSPLGLAYRALRKLARGGGSNR
jgi:SAM-dependent methyltransferase